MYKPETEKYKPWPKTREEFNEIIDSILAGPHDYNTSAEASADAAVAAFNYICSELSLTGFQAGWATMQFIKRAKGIDGPFMLIKLEDGLYPQYDLVGRLEEFIDENKDWYKEEAQKRLAKAIEYASPNVVAHWKELANA